MRFRTLELIRYGHFTEETLSFPASGCDFHLVVGPNEAGKSTLRRAVSELLFGMPKRSPMGFRHALADLRLGASIESSSGTLAFHRTRNRKSLRTPDDQELDPDALARHVGATTEAVFKRMFCLDLEGLLEGGRSILDASDDVGRMLFQSAAGVSSLGAVRESLAREAESLFTPRKAGTRVFYQALERHDDARKRLSELSVNAHRWADLGRQAAEIEQSLDEARARFEDLLAQRGRLERIRRVTKPVAHFRDTQARISDMAGTVLFPHEASRTLTESEVAIARHAQALEIHRATITETEARLAALTVDERILTHADAVESLVRQTHVCASHPGKLEREQSRLAALWETVRDLARELGWPQTEEALRRTVPSRIAIGALGTLLEAFVRIDHDHRTAGLALERHRTELDALEKQLPEAPPDPGPGLARAVEAARVFTGDTPRQRALQDALGAAELELQAATDALGPWSMDADSLRALALPGDEELTVLKESRAALASRVDTATQRLRETREALDDARVALEQFAAAGSLVTLRDVVQARGARDTLWQRIKDGSVTLATGAPGLDAAISEADRLVDAQRDRAEEAAQLSSLRNAHERLATTVSHCEAQVKDASTALRDFDSHWEARVRALGLPDMTLPGLSSWVGQRRLVLAAEAAVRQRRRELETEQSAQERALATLSDALAASGHPVADGTDLAALCDQATALLDAQREAAAAVRSARDRLSRDKTHLQLLEKESHVAAKAREQWQARWQEALTLASLDAQWMSPDTARAALDTAVRVLGLLDDMIAIRRDRIEPLQRDLDQLAAAANELATALGEENRSVDVATFARGALERLNTAREAHAQRSRWQTVLLDAQAQCGRIEAAAADAEAGLAALYSLAGCTDKARVRRQIAASDQRRELEASLRTHREAIVELGDGLSLEALLEEFDSVNVDELAGRLQDIDQSLAELVQEQNELTTRLTQVRAALEGIQGSSDAADAEAARREALAEIADAADRYIKVEAAHQLLRWAIDRYRERKQGPLLRRASALFGRLTLGGFSRLVTDLEPTPPRLIAVRADGAQVTIEGLSEGTRDQLYLALRLAALEMQIEADRPLPFIADDLFVNYHDERARAGLHALFELARRTQVIFLTHHEHLAELALALRPDTHCIRLDRRASVD